MAETSTKPYMIRALYDWCCDNGYTPYLAVAVDAHTVVPRQHVKGGEIVLNVSPMATSRLSIGNEMVEFQARFSGVAQQISVPIANISAIYARETGHGMAFDVSRTMTTEPGDDESGAGNGAAAIDGGARDDGAEREHAEHEHAGTASEDGDRHGAGSTVRSLRGGKRREPRSADTQDTAHGAAPSQGSEEGGQPGDTQGQAANGSGGGHAGTVKKEGETEAPGEPSSTAGGTRKRTARGQGGADVIEFAPSGASPKNTGASSHARAEEGAPEEGAGAEDGDEPPPKDGGGKGKGGKARLTRVK